MSEQRNFAISQALFDAQRAHALADEALYDYLEAVDPNFANAFEDWHFDPYDDSIEFDRSSPDFVLSHELRLALWRAGFDRCWVNHTDGAETYWVLPDGPSSRKDAK